MASWRTTTDSPGLRISSPRVGGALQSAVFECSFFGTRGIAKTYYAFHDPAAAGVQQGSAKELAALYEEDIALQWAMRHPNLLQLYGVAYDVFGSPMWAISEPAAAPVSALVRKGLSPPTLAPTVAQDVFSALSYLHARQVSHGNIKPSNVLFHNGVFKLADMHPGRFRHALSSVSALPANSSLYDAPEKIACGARTAPEDVWAAGLVLARILSAADLPASFAKKVEYAVSAGAHCPPLATVIRSCVSISPAERPTAASVLKQMAPCDRFGASGTVVVHAPEPPQQEQEQQTDTKEIVDSAAQATAETAEGSAQAVVVVADGTAQSERECRDGAAQTEEDAGVEAGTQAGCESEARETQTVVLLADGAAQTDEQPPPGPTLLFADGFDALVKAPAGALALLTDTEGDIRVHQGQLRGLVEALNRLLLAAPAEAHACLLHEGFLSLLAKAMLLHPDAAVHEGVLRLVASLVFRNSANQLVLLRSPGVPQAMLRVLEADAAAAGVQEYGCRALSSTALCAGETAVTALLTHADGWTITLRQSCVEAAARALQTCSDQSGVVLPACAAICNFSSSPETQASAVRAGALPAIVKAMSRHGSHAGIQEQSCRALRSIAGKNGSVLCERGLRGAVEFQGSLREAGGVAAIVRSMFMHWTNAAVIEYACRALRDVCKGGSAAAPVIPGRPAASTPPAVRRMSASPFKGKGKGEPEPAAPAVDTDSIPEGDTVVDAQIICAVIRAMGAHPASLAIQEQCLGILRNLSYRNADNQTIVARRGGISAMISAMRAHLGSAALQEEACRLISNLAENAAIAPEILSSRTAQAVTAAQQAFPKNAHIEVCAHLVSRSG